MSGSPEPVVLLHSSGMSSRQWGRLTDALSATHRVIAPDFLGEGDNPPWPDDRPFHFWEDVDVIEKLVAGLSEPAHLVGHSYGGLVALTLARRSPALVRSLAVYDPVAFGVVHDAQDPVGLADLSRLGDNPVFMDEERGGGDAWYEAFVDYWNGPGAWRGMTESGRASFLRVGRKVFLEVRSLSNDRTPASAYAHVQAPALFLTGENSSASAGRVVAIMSEAFPRARVQLVPLAGHMGPLTHGAAVNTAIVAHIRTA